MELRKYPYKVARTEFERTNKMRKKYILRTVLLSIDLSTPENNFSKVSENWNYFVFVECADHHVCGQLVQKTNDQNFRNDPCVLDPGIQARTSIEDTHTDFPDRIE